MRLHRATLQDVRCFEACELAFAPGLNLLRGPNGAGKTTVLEALGIALFGVDGARPGGAAQAVRDGARELQVAVEVELDGKRYTIERTRSVDRHKAGRASVRQNGRRARLASGDDEVDAFLAERFDVAQGGVLPLLFQRLVGVAQGGLTRPTELPDDTRRDWFAPLLNLDRYELIARRAAAAAGPFERRAVELQTERARYEGEQRGYRDLAARLEQCRQQRDEVEARVTATDQRIATVSEQLTRMEASRARFEQLNIEQAVLTEASRTHKGDADRALALLKEAQQAADRVMQNRQAFAQWEQLEASCRALEMRRRELGDVRAEVEALEDRLADGRATVEAERDRLTAELEENQQRTEDLLGERDHLRSQLEAQRGRSRRAEGAEGALAVAMERSARLMQAIAGIEPEPGAAEEADDEAARREEEARRAEQAAEEAAERALNAELDALRARAATLSDADSKRAEARRSLTQLERLERIARERMEELSPAHGACPYLEAPCQNIGGKSLVEHFQRELDQLQATRAAAIEAEQFATARAAEASAAAAELRDREKALADRARKRARGGAAASRTDGGAKRAGDAAGGRSGARHRLDFDEISHQLSGLAGVVGALDRRAGDDADAEPIALLGEVAGEGDTGPIPTTRITLPKLDEIERAHGLARDGSNALRQAPGAVRDQAVHDLAVRLATELRRVHAGVSRAHAELRTVQTTLRERARAAEETLLQSTRELESLAVERARLRATIKKLSSDDLGLLETETALSEARVRLGDFERVDGELVASRQQQERLRRGYEIYQANALLAGRVDAFHADWKRVSDAHNHSGSRLQQVEQALAEVRAHYQPEQVDSLRREREEAYRELGEVRESARSLAREAELLEERLGELSDARKRLEELDRERARVERGAAVANDLAALYRSMSGPIAGRVGASVAAEAERLYRDVAARPARLIWDQDFALHLSDGGERDFTALAHGDQVTAALALQLALLKQFPRLGLLLLDEPTAHLDPDRRRALAAALERFVSAADGYLEQVLVVTHDDAFDSVAAHRQTLPSPAPRA